METTIVIIILIVVVILLLTLRGFISSRMDILSKQLIEVRKELLRLNKSIENIDFSKKNIVKDITKPDKIKKPIAKDEKIEEKPIEVKQEVTEDKKPVETVEVNPIEIDKKDEETKKQKVEENIEKQVPLNKLNKKTATVNSKVSTKPRKKTKPKKKTNIEKFIGENLINKIGIIILVIGIGFSVKYAIDQNWIGKAGRVLIGVVSGGILIGIAHKLRKQYTAFSSVLVGGGLAVLYVTMYISHQIYELVPKEYALPVMFSIMVVITIFAVLLSLGYDKKELAVFAILGGFATPLMLNSGEGNYKAMFTYIIILDLGMLVLAYFKKWNIVNFVSYIFTVILYSSWLIYEFGSSGEPPYLDALIFASIFYIIFFLMNIINNLKESTKFTAWEFISLISLTFFYYAAGMVILHYWTPGYKGLFTAVLAILNFLFAYPLYVKKRIDNNLVYLLIGMVLTFISLSAPVQLNGNYITLFWAAEAVVLLWLAIKSELFLAKVASIIVIFLMIISLVIDWFNVYIEPAFDAPVLPIILNKGFVTSMVAVASLVISIILLKKSSKNKMFSKMSKGAYNTFITVFIIIALYISFFLELNYQLKQYIPFAASRTPIIGAFNFAFILGTLLWSTRRTVKPVYQIMTGLALFSSLIFISYYNYEFINARDSYIDGTTTSPNSLFHFLSSAFIIVSLYIAWKNTEALLGKKSIFSKLILWFVVFVLIFILSADLDNSTVLMYANNEEGIGSVVSKSHKIGFPILWSISSFAFMIAGMKLEIKEFRFVSLSLFLITLIKLFAYDVWEMSEIGRVASFVILGIILLIVSFMYQKLKNLVLDTDDENEVKE